MLDVPRYFFDTRTDDRVVTDDEGIVLSDLHAARAQATEALADMANDLSPSARSDPFR